MATVKSIQTLTLDLPPSCIQFCPTRSDIFAVGGYFLHVNDEPQHAQEQREDEDADKDRDGNRNLHVDDDSTADENGRDAVPDNGSKKQEQQKRTGSLILCRLVDNDIAVLSTTSTDFAILDLQWRPTGSKSAVNDHDSPPPPPPPLLAVATSTGLLVFYRLSTNGNELVHVKTSPVSNPETLVLSLTWHRSLSTDTMELIITLSDGRVCLITTDFKILTSGLISRHSLEAWCACFATNDPLSNDKSQVVLSGGDDMALRATALVGGDVQVPHQAERILDSGGKIHQAGITAILPLSEFNLMLTGSYDDHVRLLSIPTAGAKGRTLVLAEMDLGGGVWRLKVLHHQHGERNFVLLASCMHAGARVVRLSCFSGEDGEWTFEVLYRFEEHESMNYGSDVQPCASSTGENMEKTIVSTSFYDKRMCLWRVTL